MNRTRPFASAQNPFKPALQYISRAVTAASNDLSKHRRSSSASLDGRDVESFPSRYPDFESNMSRSSRRSSNELQTTTVPLIDLSHSPAPHYRNRSAAQSEDEDDDFDLGNSIRPLVSGNSRAMQRGWKGIFTHGGLGNFWFGTWLGWQVYVGVLVFWFGGCSFGLLLMNRFVLLTGVYKFPYPLVTTWLQLLLTHMLLLGFASLTRTLAKPLRSLGLGAIIAPSVPATTTTKYKALPSNASIVQRIIYHLTNGSGGIAGGGIFECDKQSIVHVAPLALIYVLKVMLSNLSFASASQTVYQLARIGVIPMSLILTATMSQETHSESTLSSTLIGTIFLGIASIRTDVRVTWETIIAGVISSFFVALYPIVLLRTYRLLVADLVPQGDILTGFPAATGEETAVSREETRAYWQTLHYTSALSVSIFTPIVLLSGEIGNVLRNCYFLDVPFFWFLTVCGGVGSWAVFSSTLLLTKATSPLTVTFLSIPRGAFQLLALSKFRIPAHSWVGVILCTISSLWFLVARRNEGRMLDRLRLEGR